MLPDIQGVSAYSSGGIYEELSYAKGLSDVGRRAGVCYGDQSCLRTWKQQLFREGLPGVDALYAVGIPEEMAEF